MMDPGQSDESAAEESEIQESVRLLNRAYGCYAFIAMAILAFIVIGEAAPSGEGAEGYGMMMGMLVGIPLLIAGLVAWVIGFMLTLRFKRHRGLVFLCLIHIVFPVGAIIISASDILPAQANLAEEYAAYVIFGIYVMAATVVPVWWFTTGRRRNREKALIRP